MNLKEALTAPALEKPFGKYNKLSVWVLLLTYFLSVFIWISPEGAFKNAMLYYIKPLIGATSIGQSWSVFAPGVRDSNYHETALICFEDGSSKLYEFPRMEKLNYWLRFRREKYRKMFLDCMPWPDFSLFLPEFARYIARSNACPGNEPVMVTLVHNWCPMPPADPEHWVQRDQLPEHIMQTPLYVYRVQPEDWR